VEMVERRRDSSEEFLKCIMGFQSQPRIHQQVVVAVE
jgi:hypothetical protein